MRTLVLINFLLLTAAPGTAQSLVFQHFGIEEGLPSTEVHDVYQDSAGYIWLATDHGLCRYDGFEFQVFSTREGLTDNTVFDIVGHPAGGLLLTTYSGGITWFRDGRGEPFPHNDRLKQFIGDQYVHYVEMLPDGSLQFRYMLSQRPTPLVARMDTLGEISLHRDLRPGHLVDPVLRPGEGADYFHELEMAIRSGRLAAEEGSEYHFSQSGRIYWRAPDRLLVYDPGNGRTDVLSYGYRHYAVLEDSYGNCWFSDGEGKGLKVGKSARFGWEFDQQLSGLTVSDVMEDREGNIWIATVDRGVFKVINSGIWRFEADRGLNGKVLSLARWDGKLWAGVHSGDSYFITPDLNVTYWSDCEYTAGAFAMEAAGEYLWSTSKCLVTTRGTNRFALESISPKAVAVDPMGELYIGGVLGLARLRVNGPDLIAEEILADSLTIYALHLDQQDQLWVGALSGLWCYRNGQMEDMRDRHPLFYTRITDVEELGRDTILLATKGEGVLLFTPDTIYQVNTPEGLNSQFVKSLYVQNDSTVWVGGNQGVNRLRLRWTATGLDVELASYQFTDGLPSNEIFDFAEFNGDLWMATSAGLCWADPQSLERPVPVPKLNLKGIWVNGQEISPAAIPELGSRENNIRIEYIGLYFRNPESVQYRYQLKGYDTDWRTTRLQEISYTNLPQGKYEFQLMAGSPTGQWNELPIDLEFSIRKPFYREWWFLILAVLAGMAFMSGVFLVILWRQRRQAAIARRILQSEQKALRAQINPHFVFNAMNSIQYFITENDRHNAGIYLSRFSKLMRRILDNSKKNFISLEEELAGLRHYLELEQMRFSENFEYRLTIAPDVDTYEIEIPAMILQPFLENAIWHGLMKKQERGLLEVDFFRIKGFLRCIIKDNGIGREAAALHRRQRHQSTGLQNIQERIQLINAQYNSDMKFEIEDMYDENGEALGTKVTVDFPVK